MSSSARRIGDRRVAAVEDADLHQFVGRDVGGEGDPDVLQRRAAGRELVLDHPLPERLAEHRPGVLDAVGLAKDVALAIGRGRRDAVDHRVGEGDVVADPLREFGIGELGEARDRVLGHMAVAGDVVAGHHGEGRNARRAAALEARRDQAEGGLRRRRRARVVDDVGVGRIEALGRGRDVVAALGHGQRHDPDLGPRERAEHRLDVERRDEVDHRAGDAHGGRSPPARRRWSASPARRASRACRRRARARPRRRAPSRGRRRC